MSIFKGLNDKKKDWIGIYRLLVDALKWHFPNVTDTRGKGPNTVPILTRDDESKDDLDKYELNGRLRGVCQFLHGKSADTFRKIWAIHDHEGSLLVVWWENPTKEDKDYFGNAWEEATGCEDRGNVEHCTFGDVAGGFDVNKFESPIKRRLGEMLKSLLQEIGC